MNVVNTNLESWSGPDTPVDMIMASQMLYYVNKPRDAITRLLEWLRPGGLLVIILGDENSFSDVGQFSFNFLLVNSRLDGLKNNYNV